MHEYSVVRALLDQVEQQARTHRAVAVHRVRVLIGELSGVEPDLLATAYELARMGGICANAELEVVPVAARWECTLCGDPIPRGSRLVCDTCGGAARLAEGEEILLQRLEMEVADDETEAPLPGDPLPGETPGRTENPRMEATRDV